MDDKGLVMDVYYTAYSVARSECSQRSWIVFDNSMIIAVFDLLVRPLEEKIVLLITRLSKRAIYSAAARPKQLHEWTDSEVETRREESRRLPSVSTDKFRRNVSSSGSWSCSEIRCHSPSSFRLAGDVFEECSA